MDCTTKALLLLVVCCYLTGGLSQCTSGFVTLDQLTDLVEASAANLISKDDISARLGEQIIVPGISFTCDGTITKWTVFATYRLFDITSYPELQVWRSIGVNVYTKVGGCTLRPTARNDNDIYECVPDPPMSVRPGDIFGLFQPSNLLTTITVHYARNHGPPNYFIRTGGDLEPPNINFTITDGTNLFNDLPLVAVEVSPADGVSECTNGFISEPGLVAVADGLRTRNERQRVIPDINFTCNGSVTKWIVAARDSAGNNPTIYPDLQIWRSSGSGTFTLVGNTTLRLEGRSDNLELYEYTLDVPLEFQAGDVFGIFQPEASRNLLRIQSEVGRGPPNYVIDTGTALERPTDVFTLGGEIENDLPLVIAEVVMSPTPTTEGGEGDSNLIVISAGVAGGVVASISAIVIVIVCVVLCRRRRKKADKQDTQESTVYYNYDTMGENAVYASIDEVQPAATTSNANGVTPRSGDTPAQLELKDKKKSMVLVQNEAYGTGQNEPESEYDYIAQL